MWDVLLLRLLECNHVQLGMGTRIAGTNNKTHRDDYYDGVSAPNNHHDIQSSQASTPARQYKHVGHLARTCLGTRSSPSKCPSDLHQ